MVTFWLRRVTGSVMSSISREKIGRLTWCAWVAAVAIVTTCYWNLAVGYSWTLPIIGTVHGPPTPFQQTVFTGIIMMSFLMGFIASVIIMIKGIWVQRLANLLPALLFLALLVFIVYETVNGK